MTLERLGLSNSTQPAGVSEVQARKTLTFRGLGALGLGVYGLV